MGRAGGRRAKACDGHGHLSKDKFLETLGGRSGIIAWTLFAWGDQWEWLQTEILFSQADLVLQVSLCLQEKLIPGWE